MFKLVAWSTIVLFSHAPISQSVKKIEVVLCTFGLRIGIGLGPGDTETGITVVLN